MPRRATRPATPSRTRIGLLVGGLALVGGLLAVPGGPGPDTATAAAPRSGVGTRSETLHDAGRSSVRTLARQEAVGRSITPVPVPPSLGWRRPGHGASTPAPDPDSAAAQESATAVAPNPDTAATRATTTSGMAAAGLDAAAAGGPGVVGTAWNGLTDQAIGCGSSRPCVEPPDPWIAVSATHVVQMVNQSTRITTRSGGSATQVSNVAFFGVGTWNASAFAADPRVLYDPVHDRWVATLFAGTCSGGALFIAISQTGDPTGNWQRLYKTFSGRWPDFPTLGYSSSLVAAGVNEFAVSCGTGGSSIVGAYKGASLQVLDWSDLLDGGSATISSTSPNASAFTYVPAAGLSAGDALHAAVALPVGTGSTANLAYVSLAGTIAGGDLAISPPANLAPLGLATLRQPPTPVDAGGLIGVQRNALDLRPTDAVWRDGRLAVASTTSCPRGTSYRPCGRVIELTTQANLSIPALRQDLRILPTAGYSDTFVPGVGYSDDGTLWTVFSQSSPSRYVSSWARRQVPDAPGAWSAGAALVAAGRGPYGGIAGAGLNQRWGDYVGIARDPSEPGSVWQANQMADTGGGWATRVARLGDDTTPPTVGAPRPFFVGGTQATSSGIPVRIAWSATDGGSGVASVRLERSINGGSFAPLALTTLAALDVTTTVTYGVRYQFRVSATDNAGNAVAIPVVGPSFTPTLYSEGSSRVTYAGTWTISRSSSYLGGAARYASVTGRRATITLSGVAVAWISTVGPTRGSARVYADGSYQGIYTTYRSSAVYRRVITGRTFTSTATHTYRVEVRGSAGHPRVDLDAFVVLR